MPGTGILEEPGPESPARLNIAHQSELENHNNILQTSIKFIMINKQLIQINPICYYGNHHIYFDMTYDIPFYIIIKS